MLLQVLSDIHADFHTDFGKAFIQDYLKPTNVDILIVAGDLGTWKTIPQTLVYLAKHYADSDIIYVPGNHDFYGSASVEEAITYISYACRNCNDKHNVHFLNNTMEVIRDITFVGSTMWFKEEPTWALSAKQFADFKAIPRFVPWVFEENKRAVDFLKWHINSDAVVISHYLPTYQSVPERFKGDPATQFFVCDMEKLILSRKPKLWVHGHTHDSFNYMLDKTHIVCNPLGYVGRSVNQSFIPNMFIEC